MSVKKFVQSIFDYRVLANEIVDKQVSIFQETRRRFPNEEPHFHLAQTWLSRAVTHGLNPNDPSVQMAAFSETYQFACAPPSECARALGLYILYKERPDILEKMESMQAEFGPIMSPIHKAIENGSLESLYRKYNPRMASDQSA